MTDSEWLASLKVGDEVMAPGKYYRDPDSMAEVEGASKLYLVVRGEKFHRKDGRAVGTDKRWPRKIRRVTLWDREGDRRHAAYNSLRALRHYTGSDPLENVPVDRIEAALALLSPQEPTP